jgi:hypothetical protein
MLGIKSYQQKDLENIIFSLEECTHEKEVSGAKKTDVLLLPDSKFVSVNTSTDELDTTLKTCVMAHHFYSNLRPASSSTPPTTWPS